jgi:hypothetical protein
MPYSEILCHVDPELNGAATQKTTFFIVTALETFKSYIALAG